MDLTTLDIFRAVAAELSITRAASRLGRAQSNVTTRIQQLEQALGAELFSREGKRLRLTEQGEVFLRYAERLLALANEARQALTPHLPHGVLRLGTMESTAASRLPAPLGHFHQACPQVTLRVTTGPSLALAERLAAGEIDCALLAVPFEFADAAPAFLERYGFAGEPAYAETLRLVMPHGYTERDLLQRAPGLPLAAFAPGCSYRALAQQWMAARQPANTPPLAVHEVGSYHAMLACVAAGQSFSVMPEAVLALCAGAGSIELGAAIPTRTWLVWRSGYSVAAFEHFKAALRGSYTQAPAC